jgi:hypothetical protein
VPLEKRFKYVAAFKRKDILCAVKIGNRAAGRKHVYSKGGMYMSQGNDENGDLIKSLR